MKRTVLVLLMVSWLACGRSSAPEPGFVPLFDGKSLRGWQPVGKVGEGYLAEDGVLICPAEGGGNLFTEREYADFVLRFEFRLQEGSNNGVGIRSPLVGDAAYQGLEIQVLDNHSPRYKDKLRPTQYHGSVYDLAPARRGFLKPTGEWNREEIRAVGRQITVTLNGTVIVDFDLDSVTDPEVLEKHPGVTRQSGHIGFLGHGTKVEFRNIRIKEIRQESRL
ncbi:MAG: DUF1080 domain-containing protein [Acidobacteriota bacterium]|nr:DUF1080 domain-containing protein [Acidobacteriota bacterium]MDE2964370.1 DUF1080 domain-containing protein [Acidobacteriota bacterium]